MSLLRCPGGGLITSATRDAVLYSIPPSALAGAFWLKLSRGMAALRAAEVLLGFSYFYLTPLTLALAAVGIRIGWAGARTSTVIGAGAVHITLRHTIALAHTPDACGEFRQRCAKIEGEVMRVDIRTLLAKEGPRPPVELARRLRKTPGVVRPMLPVTLGQA